MYNYKYIVDVDVHTDTVVQIGEKDIFFIMDI